MANFYKPNTASQRGWESGVNRQRLGLGESAEVALFGGDFNSDKLVVTLNNGQIAELRELEVGSAEYGRLSAGAKATRIFRLYGRVAGNAMLEARDKATRNVWCYIQVTVESGVVTGTGVGSGTGAADLLYNGIQLAWLNGLPPGERPRVYHATSGGIDHQFASFQKDADLGPIPQGIYKFKARIDPHFYTTTLRTEPNGFGGFGAVLDIREGIQKVVVTQPDKTLAPHLGWGPDRVRLTPVKTVAPHRGGFYLHDSVKGFTHGCIESEGRFFDDLRKAAASQSVKEWMTVEVKYGADASTYGDTKVK